MCSTNRCLTCLLNAFVPHQDQVRIGTVVRETEAVQEGTREGQRSRVAEPGAQEALPGHAEGR